MYYLELNHVVLYVDSNQHQYFEYENANKLFRAALHDNANVNILQTVSFFT